MGLFDFLNRTAFKRGDTVTHVPTGRRGVVRDIVGGLVRVSFGGSESGDLVRRAELQGERGEGTLPSWGHKSTQVAPKTQVSSGAGQTTQQLQSGADNSGSQKVSRLIADLNGGDDAKVRLEAAIELSRNPSDATMAALIKGLKDSAPDVRGCCAESLRMLKDPRAVEPLVEVLLTDAEHQPAYYAAKALGTLRTPRAIEGLISALEQRKADISEVCFQLGEVRTKEAVQPLVGAVKDLQNVSAYARRHAIMALENIGDSRARQAFEFALNDPDEGVRVRAQDALRHFIRPQEM